jgi:hypothetical protein
MAFNVGGLIGSLNLDISNYERNLKRAKRSARLTSKAMRRQFDNIERRIRSTSNTTRQLGSSIKDLTRILSGIVIAQTFYKIITSAQKAAQAVSAFSQEMERARLSLTLMLKSQDRADSFISTMSEFAAVTDFTSEQVIGIARRFQAMGFEASVAKSMLETITDQVSLLGGGFDKIDRIAYAIGQIRNSSKLASTEVRQLVNASVPIGDYLKEAFDLDTITNIGEKNIKGVDAVKAILYGMEKRSKGASEALSTSLKGMLETISDNLLLFSDQAFKPLYNVFRFYVKGVRDFVQDTRKILTTSGIGGVFEAIIPKEIQMELKVVITSVWRLVTAFRYFLKAMKPVAATLAGSVLKSLALILPLLSKLVLGFAKVADYAMRTIPPLKHLITVLVGFLILNLVNKALVVFMGIMRAHSIVTFFTITIQKLAKAFSYLYLVMTKNPLAAVIILVTTALFALAVYSGKLDAILHSISKQFAILSGINPADILKPIDDEYNESAKEFEKNWREMTDGIAEGAEDAEDALKDFLLAFDEVFTIPKQLDDAGMNTPLAIDLKLPEAKTDELFSFTDKVKEQMEDPLGLKDFDLGDYITTYFSNAFGKLFSGMYKLGKWFMHDLPMWLVDKTIEGLKHFGNAIAEIGGLVYDYVILPIWNTLIKGIDKSKEKVSEFWEKLKKTFYDEEPTEVATDVLVTVVPGLNEAFEIVDWLKKKFEGKKPCEIVADLIITLSPIFTAIQIGRLIRDYLKDKTPKEAAIDIVVKLSPLLKLIGFGTKMIYDRVKKKLEEVKPKEVLTDILVKISTYFKLAAQGDYVKLIIKV